MAAISCFPELNSSKILSVVTTLTLIPSNLALWSANFNADCNKKAGVIITKSISLKFPDSSLKIVPFKS